MAIDRFIQPSNQNTYISPYEARIFEYDTQDSNVFISRIVNSVFKIFGDDIVIRGFDVNDISMAHNDDHVVVRVSPGTLIQDNTFIEVKDETSIKLDNVSGLDEDGRIVIHTNYKFLKTIEENPIHIGLNYISQSGSPLYNWYHDKDRIILGIIEFTKDSSDNVADISISDDKSIEISGETYWLYGFSPNRKDNLERYISHMVDHDFSSLTWDSGLKLENDVKNPGPNKSYSTNENGEKGWFDVSISGTTNSTTFTSLSDTPSDLSQGVGKAIVVSNDGSSITYSEDDLPTSENFVTIFDDQSIKSNKIFENNVLVIGDLQVYGDLTYIDQNNLAISDAEIVLNQGETGDGVSSVYSGIRIDRGTSPDVLFKYDEFNDKFGIKYENNQNYDYVVTESDLDPVEYQDGVTGKKYDIQLMNGNLVFSEV